MEPPDISWQLMTFKEKKISCCLKMLIQEFLSFPHKLSNDESRKYGYLYFWKYLKYDKI